MGQHTGQERKEQYEEELLEQKRRETQKTRSLRKLTRKVKALNIALVIGTASKTAANGDRHQMVIYQESDKRPVPVSELGKLQWGNYLALCPFHGDRELGSFIITPHKNMWWCFVENIGWNSIDFEKLYYGLSTEEQAVLHLARRFSLMSEWELNLFKEEFRVIESGEAVEVFQPSFVETASYAVTEQVEVPAELRHFAYSMLKRALKLSKKHQQQLKLERRVDEKYWDDYFTMPSDSMDVARVVYVEAATVRARELFGKGLYELRKDEQKALESDAMMKALREYMKHIAGFYESGGRIRFSTIKGMGFFVRDRYGVIQGIHVRKDEVKENGVKKKKESRYKWVSSKFAIGKPGFSGGSSPKSPMGVLIPEGVDIDRDTDIAVYITEGRFKAEAIRAEGCICIYLAGVGSWKQKVEEIENIIGKRKEVYLVFDADLMFNTTVYKQLHNLSKTLQKRRPGFKVSLLLWPESKGKGFDDLVNNNGREYLRIIKKKSFDNFEKYIYIPAFNETLAPYGKKYKDLNNEEADQFAEQLQKKIEDIMF